MEYQYMRATLASDFGFKLFMKKVGSNEAADQILSELGTYSRGKNKGKPRGYIHWVKVTKGGHCGSSSKIPQRYAVGGFGNIYARGSFGYTVTDEWNGGYTNVRYELDMPVTNTEKQVRRMMLDKNLARDAKIRDLHDSNSQNPTWNIPNHTGKSRLERCRAIEFKLQKARIAVGYEFS